MSDSNFLMYAGWMFFVLTMIALASGQQYNAGFLIVCMCIFFSSEKIVKNLEKNDD